MFVTIQLDGPQLHFYADQKMHVELGFFDDSPPKNLGDLNHHI